MSPPRERWRSRKRSLDLMVGIPLFLATLPLLLVAAVAVWLEDRESPLFVAPRAGRDGVPFNMIKLRSMRRVPEMSGVTSTSASDPRITRVGRVIRSLKIDELPQLIHVIMGQMSLVGPRPQLLSEVEKYSAEERGLLDVKPGITDFASIVFADEAEILHGKSDPNRAYDLLIRPWKSSLGLFYRDVAAVTLDLKLLWLTVLNAVNRERALSKTADLLQGLGAPEELVSVARRETDLELLAARSGGSGR